MAHDWMNHQLKTVVLVYRHVQVEVADLGMTAKPSLTHIRKSVP